MKRRTQRLLLTLAAAGVLGTTAAAWAATGDRGTCHGPADGPRAERLHQRHAERGAQRMAEHQAQLKAALKLTPAQEGAWKQFTQALQTSPTPHQGLERDDWTRLTTPQRLEKMQAFQAARQARMGTATAEPQPPSQPTPASGLVFFDHNFVDKKITTDNLSTTT
jgi:hypothetical protein